MFKKEYFFNIECSNFDVYMSFLNIDNKLRCLYDNNYQISEVGFIDAYSLV